MKRFIQAIALLAATIALAACGFQLRGQYNFDFETIELRGMENSEMNRNMDLQLQILNLKVNPPEGAPLKLNLISETRDRSIVTFSATGRAREVRLTYELLYNVVDKQGDFLIATSQLSQRRELTYTDDQILGKEAEENQLYTEMQRDIARQITGRLSALQLGQKRANHQVKQIALDTWLNNEASTALPQLLCVFTDEPLFATQAADLYRQRLKKQTDYQRQIVEVDRQFDPQEFLSLFAEASLFGDVSLVDLRINQPKLSKEAAEALSKAAQWIAAGDTSHYLLVNAPKLNKTQEKSAGFADLLAKGTEIACRPVGADTLPGWIAQAAKRKGVQLNRETCAWLAEKTEGNLLVAHQTIEKLALEHQSTVTIEHVQGMVANSARFNVFDLGGGLLAGDAKRITRMMEGLEAEGEAPTLVLWALQEEIRAIRDTQQAMRRGMSLSDACRQNRIWGQRQNHIASALKRHTPGSLQKLTALCYAAEKTIKGMKQGNPWTLFEIIGLGLAGIEPPELWNT